MKKILYFLTTLFLFSCSTSSDVVSHNLLQKRKYNKGYFYKKHQNSKTEFHNSNNSDAIIFKPSISNLLLNEQIVTNNSKSLLTASAKSNFSKTDIVEESLIKLKKIKINQKKINKLLKIINKKTQKNNPILTQLISPCDVVIMMDGSEVTAKILEITPYEIKYKNCDNLEGPTFTKSLSTVFKIKYANGTSQMMNNTQDNYTDDSDILGLGLEEGEKSQSIAIALWFFLGVVGVHRFYLGHIGLGVLYLLTFGLCGVGWLIDGILFLTGDLKPANGKAYGEKII
jgi:TM2 domain-containing membrane protein YozV